MLVIRADLVDAMLAHARADHPDEACGVLAGPDGSDRPERHIAMVNAERSPTFYRFDSAEQLKVWRALDNAGEVPVVIYHSHTATEAYPSRTDVSLAAEPDAHYVLVSTRHAGRNDVRSYRIIDGVVTEEPVSIVEEYGDDASHAPGGSPPSCKGVRVPPACGGEPDKSEGAP
jgi:proteasome lid subunit RPN8/RPN11